MSWLKKIFGYRTRMAASSNIPMETVALASRNICATLAGFGYPVESVFVANTNSMIPTFDSNAALLVERVSFDELSEGDIVIYHGDPVKWGGSKLIVHRANERTRGGWWTIGDGNGSMDPEIVTSGNLYGRVCGILYGRKSVETNS
jgi:signal peptidase I